MTLIDTDVLIDLRFGSPESHAWLKGLGNTALAIPGMVALEFLIGSSDKPQLERSRKFIATLDVQWHDEADNSLAYELVVRHRLSTGLGLGDFLIAAQALNRGATLLTFNLRHFGAIPGLDARAPYPRTPPARP